MKQRGFTLLEVVVALAILGLSLGVLLQAQASSVRHSNRARDVSIAAMLARSKMIDIELYLFDEGFKLGDEEEKGDFEEEGFSNYTWEYKISEVELDLGGLTDLCAGLGAVSEEDGASGDCEALLGQFGGMVDTFTQELSSALRLVELTVTWADGKFQESFTVRALMTREDFKTGGSIDQLGTANELNQALQPGGANPGTGTGGRN